MMGFIRDQRGIAAVEAALALPVLLVLGLGTADVSWMLAQSHRVEQGLAAGGGYLAKSGTPEAHVTRAQNLAVTGQFTGGDARVDGWSAGDVSVTFRSVAGDYRTGDRGRVVVLETSVPYRGFGILSSIREDWIITATHEERVDL